MNGEETFAIRIKKACEHCSESCPFFEYEEHTLPYTFEYVAHTIRQCKKHNVCRYICSKLEGRNE